MVFIMRYHHEPSAQNSGSIADPPSSSSIQTLLLLLPDQVLCATLHIGTEIDDLHSDPPLRQKNEEKNCTPTEKGEIAPIDLTASEVEEYDDSNPYYERGSSSGESPSSQADRYHLAPIQAHFLEGEGKVACLRGM